MNVAPSLTPEIIEERIRALGPWFHNMKLGGMWTAPDHFLGDYPGVKFRRFADTLPADMTGKTVLDIGCNGGFYAIEMKRRGADRVLGIDFDEAYLSQARFAAEVNGLAIEFRKMSVYDVGSLGERFDLVIFMGVLYHLRHPLLALDIIHDTVAKDLLLFQSLQRGSATVDPVAEDYDFWQQDHFDSPGYPRMFFVEHRYSGDPTNWWIPNTACSAAMLRSAGFTIEAHPEEEVFLCRRTALAHPGAVYPSKDTRP
ncbi:TIGR04290 family methyltransferase [Lichenifustis flavocetrariae]|uniref:TIGR04290 family methyltransferase n=1 Tax=Lichenifustis flavocetrariae TaxID=2949735 RepID=A0AA41YTS8_9HYPH|nr:TIGR04290 family methyltransferase [Lichenifustis flavocetrariae]MCW6507185.1 TIGR04290 family methyltransferase [Lichenifustis flavocetrariae]